MKRADLTTEFVLGTVNSAGTAAFEVLCEYYPPKVVLAAFRREVDADRLDYGVAETRPWLTEKGKRVLLDAAVEESP